MREKEEKRRKTPPLFFVSRFPDSSSVPSLSWHIAIAFHKETARKTKQNRRFFSAIFLSVVTSATGSQYAARRISALPTTSSI
jgi:hypothetical protein